MRSVQLVETGPDTLAVRLDTAPDHDHDHGMVWKDVQARLRDHLSRHDLELVDLIHDPQPPQHNPHSGKLRQVIVASEARGG